MQIYIVLVTLIAAMIPFFGNFAALVGAIGFTPLVCCCQTLRPSSTCVARQSCLTCALPTGLSLSHTASKLQDFILPALLYLTAKRPRAWVWVLNITITVVYTCVAVVGAVGAFKLIIEVSTLGICGSR